MLARIRQFTVDPLTTESIKPAVLKLCVDIEFLYSNIALGFIMGTYAYEVLSDKQ